VPNILGGATPGQDDSLSIASLGLGGALQATYTAPLFGHGNHLVVGASLDHADVDFNSTNVLGIILEFSDACWRCPATSPAGQAGWGCGGPRLRIGPGWPCACTLCRPEKSSPFAPF
jgi:hypothetical protein